MKNGYMIWTQDIKIQTMEYSSLQYDKLTHRKSWGKPDHASTLTAKPNIYGSGHFLCIWGDQLGAVCYELFKENETLTWDRCRTIIDAFEVNRDEKCLL